MRAFSSPLLAVAIGCIVGGCSGSNTTTPSGVGGSSGVGDGGAPSTGGATTAGGGVVSTGGAAATGGNVPSSGGAEATTGGNGAGGTPPATGGAATGGANSPTGGRMATGGSPAGGAATGGAATGGAATGGAAMGGAATGGAKATGGAATGGQAPAGGAATGGAATGGVATGGAKATGGSTAAGGSSTGQSSGCGKTPTIASSNYNNGHHIAITVGTMAREYILNVPTNYSNTTPYKLVIAYHELNGNDDEMYSHQYYHLLSLSNNSTIFVAPNGQQNNANCTQASGCGWPNPNDSDMLLADAVVAQVEQNFCVDTNRIFATGWSYGASMSYETACERPLGGTSATWGVRAIAVYSAAQLSGSCTPTKPVAYYASHGTSDSVLCYDTTTTNGCSFASAGGGVKLCQNYATVDGCTWATPTKVTSGNHVCTNLTGCTTGYPVEFCSFNGDHTPDPTDSGQSTSWEYQNVWTFLSQF